MISRNPVAGVRGERFPSVHFQPLGQCDSSILRASLQTNVNQVYELVFTKQIKSIYNH